MAKLSVYSKNNLYVNLIYINIYILGACLRETQGYRSHCRNTPLARGIWNSPLSPLPHARKEIKCLELTFKLYPLTKFTDKYSTATFSYNSIMF